MIAEAAAGSHPDSAMDMCPHLDVTRYEMPTRRGCVLLTAPYGGDQRALVG
jgi:hypothetical protein